MIARCLMAALKRANPHDRPLVRINLRGF